MASGRSRTPFAALFVVFFATVLPNRSVAQTGGQAELAVQGYYLNGQQTLLDTSGLALHFQQFVPNLGLLSGSLENYESQGRWRQGDDFLQLRGAPWQGYRWNLTGGDFQVSTILTANPFTNLYYPELSLRGFETEVSRGNLRVSLFYGAQTLLEGPRIPFRVPTGEHVSGGTAHYRIGEKLELGVRLLHITANPDEVNSFLFPANRRFRVANSAALTALYRPSRFLQIFAETSASSGTETSASNGTGTSVTSGDVAGNPTRPSSNPLSTFLGATFESDWLTVRANYSDQGVLYLPLAGYFAGDRRGPFGEIRLRPFRRLDVFASASQYSNNREHDGRVPTFDSLSQSAGVSLQLPSKFALSAQVSTIRFDSAQGSSSTRSDNQQWTATLNRPIGRHNLRVTYREMQLATNSRPDRQISREVEDMVQFRNLLVGGSARLDSALGDQHRNTFFGRGTVQVRFHSLTAYSYVDFGRDLVNQSVFATSSVNSTIMGVTARLPGSWNLSAEAFRNTLTTALNPGNVFILQGQGVAIPTTLAGLNQWSLFFRISKQFHWGATLPNEGLDRYTSEHVPITGIVLGEVYETTAGGRVPVSGVPVSVDNSRVAVSGAAGSYRLEAVPEGQHEIALRVSELPTDFEPGNSQSQTIQISTRRVTRLDFEVFRLGEVCGRVNAPGDIALESIVIHLRPTARYTTPEADGSFCFHNARAGTYDIELDPTTLPALTALTGPNHVTFVVEAQGNGHLPEFRLEQQIQTKPIRRKILDGNAPSDETAPPHSAGSSLHGHAPFEVALLDATWSGLHSVQSRLGKGESSRRVPVNGKKPVAGLASSAARRSKHPPQDRRATRSRTPVSKPDSKTESSQGAARP